MKDSISKVCHHDFKQFSKVNVMQAKGALLLALDKIIFLRMFIPGCSRPFSAISSGKWG